MRWRVCMRVCMRVCVCTCVRVYVCACMRACVRARTYLRFSEGVFYVVCTDDMRCIYLGRDSIGCIRAAQFVPRGGQFALASQDGSMYVAPTSTTACVPQQHSGCAQLSSDVW